jgi:SAM-dependent methyltransferase
MFRRLSPISRTFGLDRGQCIDRFYIERFLASHARDIRGAVLEIGDDGYARRFGRDHLVTCDVLHVEAGHPGATIVADLAHADGMASDAFDCIIVTQTLQFIYGVQAAVETLHRLLKPGGVLLATVPGISQISRFDMDRWGEYWRFTTLSTRRLLEDVFPPANVSVEAQGNVLAAVAFLHGLAAEELRLDELDYHDADYQLLIAARAVK